MSDLEQISRRALVWLLVAQAVVLMPHGLHAPYWTWVIWLFVVAWRWQIFRGAWKFPGRLVKFLIIGICCGLLLLSFRGKLDMQVMVCLVLIGFMLKLLEMKRRHDFLIVCYLGYFVIATQFLFFSTVFAAVFGLFSLALLTTALLAVNQSLLQQGLFRSLRLGTLVVLQAIPLMLLLFVVMPRLGPLWSVPTNTTTAKTGMSDTMSPGDFNQLMMSDELAFRVTFIEGSPRPSQLYWRGLVFSGFDGRRWSQAHAQLSRNALRWGEAEAQEWLDEIEFSEENFRYEIIMEPSYQPWLFSLTAPKQWSDDSIGMGKDLRLQNKKAVTQRMQYKLSSDIGYRYQVSKLEDWQLRQELYLPVGINPRTRELAQTWMTEVQSPELLIQKLLTHFRENFTYTLQPELLGAESVDSFLWQTRAGFCEHFAGSFVFFMRAAGVPARVVVGYQGGTYNQRENYWVVRQRDAHAWTEVWLEGKGWIRVDPTAAVAPERIERGIDFSLSDEDSNLLGNAFSRRSMLINEFTMRLDALNYHWSRLVLNYDSSRQEQFLGSLLGGLSPWKIALFVLISGGVILLLISTSFLWRGKRYQHPADRHYLRFSRKLARVGLVRMAGETPRNFALRVIAARPDLQKPVSSITQLYELISYADNQSEVSKLAIGVARFSPGTKFRRLKENDSAQ